MPVTLATVTGRRFDKGSEGSAWLASIMRDRARAADEVRHAVRTINRALSAWRAGGHDPLVTEVGASKALGVRLGHGTGQELAEGRWTEAKELPRPRAGRLEGVDPQSRVAAVLAGRDEVHPAETLMLRARLDAELGRPAAARHGLRAARAALEEDPPARPKELRQELERIERKLSGSDEPLAD